VGNWRHVNEALPPLFVSLKNNTYTQLLVVDELFSLHHWPIPIYFLPDFSSAAEGTRLLSTVLIGYRHAHLFFQAFHLSEWNHKV
jgi:hypothetical protein